MLTILPGTLPEEELTARLAAADSAVVLKLGRTFPAVRRALERAGAARATPSTSSARRWPASGPAPLRDVDPESVPYFSMAVLPSKVGDPRAGDPTPTSAVPAARSSSSASGRPGPRWLTPEARGALAAADDLVGYTTYVDRVPVRPGQRRHGSDNKVGVGAGRVRPRPGPPGPSGRGRLLRRPRCLRHGQRRARGRQRGALLRRTGPRGAGDDRGARRRRPGGRAARPRLRHHLALRPAQAVGGRRRAAGGRGRRRPGPRAVQPGVAGAGPGRSAGRGTSCWSIAPRTRPWSWRGTSAAPRSRSGSCTLADLDPAVVDMRTLLIVGSSQTRAVTRADGGEVVWTPRRYPR